MAWFQIEIGDLRKKLKSSEAEVARLKAEILDHEIHKSGLEGASETAKFVAKESHNQNLDILKHMDRMEKQVELLRKQEKDAQGAMNTLQQRMKEKDGRITTVEGQLEHERNRVANMVPRDEMDIVEEKCRTLEQKLEELDEHFQAKQRDYMSIVEAYNKVSGQGMELSTTAEARPLTPRPQWFHCRGLLDPDYQHTFEKAQHGQDIMEHMLVCTRTLLSAYGLDVAANKSQVFQQHATHPLTQRIAITPEECKLLNRSFDGVLGPDEESETLVNALEAKREKTKPSAFVSEGGTPQDLEEWIPGDIEPDTPQVFKHSEQVKNLRFSRRRVSEFMDSLLQMRSKNGVKQLLVPFSDFLYENIPQEVLEDDRKLWAINMFAALRRYSAEPDYLAYMLLVKGKISDSVVQDNKRLCGELLKIFTNYFHSADGSHNITKQKFFYGLREVLPNKEKEMWQDLVTYFPAGGAELLVNYEWLLFDDLYVLSPIVYALRLQHLEEAIGLTSRLDKVVRSCSQKDPHNDGHIVTYEKVEEAFRDDAEFGLIHADLLAQALECHVADMKPETQNEIEKFLMVLKQGDIFRILFFPALASDDGDNAGQEDMP